jgi:hypothetical protein
VSILVRNYPAILYFLVLFCQHGLSDKEGLSSCDGTPFNLLLFMLPEDENRKSQKRSIKSLFCFIYVPIFGSGSDDDI